MAKWNMIPSAEGPFKGLDAMARYCFGLLYDRYKLSERSVDEYRSEKFLGARMVKLCDLNPRKFQAIREQGLAMTLIAYTNKKTLPTRWVARNAPSAAVWTRAGSRVDRD